MDVQSGVAQMDKFAAIEELKYSPTGNPSLEPSRWRIVDGSRGLRHDSVAMAYADRFAFYDNIFESMTDHPRRAISALLGATARRSGPCTHQHNATVPLVVDDIRSGIAFGQVGQSLPVNPAIIRVPGSVESDVCDASAIHAAQHRGRCYRDRPERRHRLGDVPDDVAFLSKFPNRSRLRWYRRDSTRVHRHCRP